MSLDALVAAIRQVDDAHDASDHRTFESAREPGLYFQTGSVLDITGDVIIAFLTNDTTATWGGGVARRVAQQFPTVQAEFRRIVSNSAAALALGSVHVLRAAPDRAFAVLIAQAGVGPSKLPRLRYDALASAVAALRTIAIARGAQVHVPRLGAGASGGNWPTVEALIRRELAHDVVTVVHDLPPRRPKAAADKVRRPAC